MKLRWVAACAVLLVFALAVAQSPAEAAPTEEGTSPAQLQMPWDQPPPEFKEVQRKGFDDGVKAAINDYDHHRSPEYGRRKEYRHPHVSRSLQEDYRKGFEKGYDDGYRHIMRSSGHRQ